MKSAMTLLFRTKLLIVQMLIFFLLITMLLIAYVYVSNEYQQYIQSNIRHEIELEEDTIRNNLALAASNIQKNRTHYKKIHEEAIRLYHSQVNSEEKSNLNKLKQELKDKYRLSEDDFDIFLVNRDMVVYDATLEKDIGYDLSSFEDTSIIITKAFSDNQVHVSNMVSQDLLNESFKIYSYGTVDHDTILEMSFIDRSSSQVFNLIRQNMLLKTQESGVESSIYQIYSKNDEYFYFENRKDAQAGKTKQQVYLQAKKFPLNQHNNNPIMKAFFTDKVVSFEDKSENVYYYYDNLFDGQPKNTEYRNIVVKYAVSLESRNSLLNTIRRILLVITIISLSMLLALHLFFRKHLLKPMDVITNGIRKQSLIPINRLNNHFDELYKISDAYNNVFEHLNNEIEKNAKQIYIDPLTKVNNRKAFDERFTELLQDFKQTNQSFCIILFDIDNFKNINDEYGHSMGDEVLKSMAELTHDTIRENDNFYRVGGEEFVILLSDTMLKPALEVAERVRFEIESHFMDWETGVITISAGVAEVAREDTYKKLYKRADKLLYTAKHQGKNRVCF